MSQDLFSDSQLFTTQDDEEVDENGGEGSTSGAEVLFSQQSTSRAVGQPKDTLMTNNLSEELKSKHKYVFVDIGQKTKEAENVSDICRSTKILTEQMDRQNKYYLSGGVNENMPLDAKAIVTNASVTRQVVKRLQTDSKQFDSQEFAEKLLTALNPFARIDANDSLNDSHMSDPNDWSELGRKYCRFHRVVPTFHFIHGSFDSALTETENRVPKPRVRHPKPVIAAQTEATQIDAKLKVTEDSTPEEVELIVSTIKRLEAKNSDHSSLPYIEVIVNPKSMSETVENIFHSAFLVKDGMARVVDNEEGGPGIQSIDHSQVDITQQERGIQSVFSFSMQDWNYWIQKFEIKKPAIRHTKKASDK